MNFLPEYEFNIFKGIVNGNMNESTYYYIHVTFCPPISNPIFYYSNYLQSGYVP